MAKILVMGETDIEASTRSTHKGKSYRGRQGIHGRHIPWAANIYARQ